MEERDSRQRLEKRVLHRERGERGGEGADCVEGKRGKWGEHVGGGGEGVKGC